MESILWLLNSLKIRAQKKKTYLCFSQRELKRDTGQVVFSPFYFLRGRWSMVWTFVGLFCSQLLWSQIQEHSHPSIPSSSSFPQLTHSDRSKKNICLGLYLFEYSLDFFRLSSLSHIKALQQSFQECYIYRSVFCQ